MTINGISCKVATLATEKMDQVLRPPLDLYVNSV
jgi:hypothetical protein